MFEYTKQILTKVSFDRTLFRKELVKSLQILKKDERRLLKVWCVANVAAENPIVEFTLYFKRNFFFQFNGEVGNAFATINNVWRDNGFCRAGINALSAGAAIIFYRQVGFQFKVKN